MEHAKIEQGEKDRHFLSVDGKTFHEFFRKPDHREIRLWAEMYLSPEGLERWERVAIPRDAVERNGGDIVTL